MTGLSAARGELTDQLIEAIGEPKLAALILGQDVAGRASATSSSG